MPTGCRPCDRNEPGLWRCAPGANRRGARASSARHRAGRGRHRAGGAKPTTEGAVPAASSAPDAELAAIRPTRHPYSSNRARPGPVEPQLGDPQWTLVLGAASVTRGSAPAASGHEDAMVAASLRRRPALPISESWPATSPPPSSTLSGAPAEATPTMGVAAATDSPAGSLAATDVAAMVSIETFDELPMNSVLGADWMVSGGDGASIVALPTSVDRSVRFDRRQGGGRDGVPRRSTADGGAAHRVRPPPRPATAGRRRGVVSLTDRRARPADPRVRRVGVSSRRLATQGPTRELPQVRPRRTEPDRWGARRHHDRWAGRRDRLARARCQRRRDRQRRLGDRHRADGPGRRHLPASPEGTPSGWIAIDDLIIEG